jgi:hypothetical protein
MGKEDPVASPPLGRRNRRSGDGLEESVRVLGDQPSGALAGAAWVQIGTQRRYCRISVATVGVVTPKVQQLADLVEPPTKRNLGHKRTGSVVVTILGSDASEHVSPDHAVLIVSAIGDH